MSVSDELRDAAWAVEGRLPLVAATIEHDDLDEPIRVVNNNENVLVGGVEYVGLAFEVALPDSLEDAPPRAKLRLDNVSRVIGEAVRSISTPATVTLELVRVEEPLTDPPTAVVEISYPTFKLFNVQFDALSVEGDLLLEDLTREPYPAHVFSPAQFPGLVA